MPESTQGPRRLQLRKYPNRRYYDITAKVLAQIIIELDPPKLSVFPVALLHRLLRSNEQIVNDFVQRYFNQALTAFLDSQRGVEQYLRQAMGLQTPAPTVADWTKILWGPFNPSLWSAQRAAGSDASAAASPPPPPPPPTEDQALRPLVDQLQRQIADLQEQLSRSKKSQSKRSD